MLAMGWCNRRSGADCGWLVKWVLVAASALEAMICFVAFLIATKPVKPCDKSVFEALYLLLKIELSSKPGLHLACAFAPTDGFEQALQGSTNSATSGKWSERLGQLWLPACPCAC